MQFKLLWQNNCFNLTETNYFMEHNNLPQLNNNIPGYKNVLYPISLEEYKNNTSLQNSAYHTDISETANSFFTRYFSWEYFCNELEFE